MNWRWRSRGTITILIVTALCAWFMKSPGREVNVGGPSGPTVALTRVPSPCDPESRLIPLRPAIRRAIGDVGPSLTALLVPPGDELERVDPEFRRYYDDVLLPRIREPWTALSDDEVLEVDLDVDGRAELVILGTWRDTFFLHSFRFVAILGQRAGGRYVVTYFQRFQLIFDQFAVHDFDGDGTPEVVLLLRDTRSCFATVLTRASRVWSSHTLQSDQTVRLLDGSPGVLFVAHAGRAPLLYKWSRSGFQTAVSSSDP